MKDGKVPGFRHVADLYADGVHLKAKWKCLEAVTHYAVVFQQDPHDCIISGLHFWKEPYGVNRVFAEVVWDVVAEVTKVEPAKKSERRTEVRRSAIRILGNRPNYVAMPVDSRE